MTQKEITERWDQTGLLDQLDDFNKNECANSLESAVEYLLGDMEEYVKNIDKTYGEGFFAGTILPIIRRLYDNGGCLKTPMKLLFEDYGEYLIKNRPLFEDLVKASCIALDGEAEFINNYVDNLVMKKI